MTIYNKINMIKSTFRPISFDPAFKKQVARQNPQHVFVSSQKVTAQLFQGKQLFSFQIQQITPAPEKKEVVAFRIAAYMPSESLPLFPTMIGRLDYTMVKLYGEKYMKVGLAHSLTGTNGVDSRNAIEVEKSLRETYRGIGRAMMGLAINHAKSLSIPKMYVLDVANFTFFSSLPQLHTYELQHDREGEIAKDNFDSYEPEDIDIVLNMAANLEQMKQRHIPRIFITARSLPTAQVLEALKTIQSSKN